MIADSLQFGVARLSGRKDGHPNRSATPNNLRTTMIGDSKMKQIDVSTPKHSNKFALVDDADYEAMNKFKWTAVHKGSIKNIYAQRETCGKNVMMHQEIMLLDAGQMLDHRDRNGLNNQKSNLRLCSQSQNMRNRGCQKNNTSGFKGVSWHKADKKWRVSIKTKHKLKHLGLFFCIIKAAQSYDEAAIKYHGEFAWLNFPERGEV